MTMSRTTSLCLVVALLFACSVDDPPADRCPCVAGFTCGIDAKLCFRADTPAAEQDGSVIDTDGRLWCANPMGIGLLEQPSASSRVVNHLITTRSWFVCWTTGERQSGGSSTWYYTDGDDRGAPYGWLPAANVNTPAAFNENPAAWGFARCEQTANALAGLID